MREVAGIRQTGSASIDLAWTAAGRFDAFWEYDIQPWDMAAGIVLIREAGGIISDMYGGSQMFEMKSVLGGNTQIHRGLLGVCTAARASA